MNLVSAKCPNCGAGIKLDKTKESAFCMYCGGQVIVEDAISLVKIDNCQNLNNYLELSKNAINGGNGQEAFEYSNKALEVDPNISDAWLCKLKAINMIATVGNTRIAEVVQCGEKAIKYASEDGKLETSNNVYNIFLSRSLELLMVAYNHLIDTASIEQTFKAMSLVNAFTASQSTLDADKPIISIIFGLTSDAMKLKMFVPRSEIRNNVNYQKIVTSIANQYIEVCQALKDRYSIYGAKISESAIHVQKDELEAFSKGLDNDILDSIDDTKINSNTSSGCYIATAVYGSYDAPQVIVLRRFRDERLANTYLGRIFIRVYYKLSPSVANRLKNAKYANKLVENVLDGLVKRLNEN